MRRFLALTGLVLLLLAGPAAADNGQQTTTLLTPAGQPVGGIWQRWMNDSRMPTYVGKMVLDLAFDGPCGQYVSTANSIVLGCTNAAGAYTSDVQTADAEMPETGIYLNAPNAGLVTLQAALLYEQGHVIDERYLTGVARQELLAIWGVNTPDGMTLAGFWPWHNPLTGSVMNEWFAESYMLCALYPHWTYAIALHASAAEAVSFLNSRDPAVMITRPDTPRMRSRVQIQDTTCAYIRAILGGDGDF